MWSYWALACAAVTVVGCSPDSHTQPQHTRMTTTSHTRYGSNICLHAYTQNGARSMFMPANLQHRTVHTSSQLPRLYTQQHPSYYIYIVVRLGLCKPLRSDRTTSRVKSLQECKLFCVAISLCEFGPNRCIKNHVIKLWNENRGLVETVLNIRNHFRCSFNISVSCLHLWYS